MAPAPAVPNFGVFEQLTNYGALGIAALALGALAWFFIKRNMEEQEWYFEFRKQPGWYFGLGFIETEIRIMLGKFHLAFGTKSV